jgi:NAD(P)H dehydrogenase (quinone)
MTAAPTVAIIFHSGYGHTAVVAQAVADGVTAAGGIATLHQIEGPGQDFAELLAAAGGADAIIFGAPTYMGDISAALKAFFEASSKAWMKLEWKDKVAGGFTNSLSFAGDKHHSLASIFTLAMQHGMIWVGTGVLPGAHSNADAAPETINRLGYSVGVATQSDNASPDITPPAGDRAFARDYGSRIVTITRQFKAA